MPRFLSTKKSAEMQYFILKIVKFLNLPTFQNVGSMELACTVIIQQAPIQSVSAFTCIINETERVNKIKEPSCQQQ